MSFQRNSTLRQAFDSIRVGHIKVHCFNKDNGIVRYVASALDRKVGLVRERGWNLNASKKSIESINKFTELNLKPTQ